MFMFIHFNDWNIIEQNWWMIGWDFLLRKNPFNCLFCWIEIKYHAPIMSPTFNDVKVVIHVWSSLIRVTNNGEAKSLTLHLRLSVKSLMYTRKKSGPKIEPWGTPAVTEPHPEALLFKTVRCFWFARKFLMSESKFPEIPQRHRQDFHAKPCQMLWICRDRRIEHLVVDYNQRQ